VVEEPEDNNYHDIDIDIDCRSCWESSQAVKDDIMILVIVSVRIIT
jgi:hypothetical protein